MRQNEIYNELTEEKKAEIKYLHKSVDKSKLIYRYKGNTSHVNFNEYIGATNLINKIKDGDVSLREAVNDQFERKSKLGEIKKGNPNRKSKNNKYVIKMLVIFMIQDKLLLIFLLNTVKVFQHLKVEQNKKEQDLKY